MVRKKQFSFLFFFTAVPSGSSSVLESQWLNTNAFSGIAASSLVAFSGI